MSLTISLEDVEQAIGIVLGHLRDNRKVFSVNIEKEMYWNVPVGNLHDLDREPALDIGDLNEDYSDLIRIIKGKQPPLALHLIMLANVMRVSGEILSAALAKDGG